MELCVIGISCEVELGKSVVETGDTVVGTDVGEVGWTEGIDVGAVVGINVGIDGVAVGCNDDGGNVDIVDQFVAGMSCGRKLGTSIREAAGTEVSIAVCKVGWTEGSDVCAVVINNGIVACAVG